jgi:L-fuculose-phosphate aldolase
MSEGYVGVKFKFTLVKNYILDDYRLDELKKWCQIFDNQSLAPPYEGGSYGNLSFRFEKNVNQFIITGTQVGLKSELDNEKFVKVIDCNLETREIFAEGTRKPSSESMLHYIIYKTRPDVQAIFHGHSAELLKNSYFLNIPETETEDEYGSINLVNSVLKILKSNTNFINLKNHGFFSFGSNMESAGNNALNYLQKYIKINSFFENIVNEILK